MKAWLEGRGTSFSATTGLSLSPQQRRVLALVSHGKTNKEIAMELQLSEKTVRNYLSIIFEKLHITRRTQAVAFFVKQSLN